MRGRSGAGKTTYAHKICEELSAIRFSIDPWMQTLYHEDMNTLDYEWMMNRVYRCYNQIWDVSLQILNNGGNAVLDLGFTERKLRENFYTRAKNMDISMELHFLNVPQNIRRKRVERRNVEKNPDVYSFEITQLMFDFIENKFEEPNEQEITNGLFVKRDYKSSENKN